MTETSSDTPAGSKKKAEEYGRPASIEDASNRYFIHPLSNLVVKVAKVIGVTPNFVSLMGLACGLIAGIFYYYTPQISYVAAAFAAMIGWHILDGADGKLARETGQTSAFGRIIDGICDHLVFSAVYIALALNLIAAGSPTSIWWLVIGAGLSHAVQAAGYEERRQKYQRRLKNINRESVEENLLIIEGKPSFWAGLYDKAQKFVAGNDYGLDKALVSLRADASESDRVIPIINKTAPMVGLWGLLNANNRTAMIFVCAIIGQPAFFFLFELIVLNLVLVTLIFAEARLEKALTIEANALVSG